MVQNVHGTFISEKINKIRWRPDPFNDSHSFITGSWDNDQNNIKLWNFEKGEDDADIYPFVIQNYEFEGDVTEAKFINSDYCVVSSSLGSVYYLKITNTLTGDVQITNEKLWSNIHKFKNQDPSLCTSFTVYENDVVTAGEDGRVNVLNLQNKDVLRTIEEADSCSLNCITFVKHSEVLTGNSRGQMKIFDLRVKGNQPTNSFMLSGDQIAATCLAYHPNQRHMVVAGDEDGSLTVWDLRQNSFPVNLLSAHSESVSEIQFHPDHPDQMFSCSFSGELWHWITNKPGSHGGKLLNVSEMESNSWLSTESIKNKFEVFMLMPKLHKAINSIDLSRDRVLCGCDNEAIYLINKVNIYS
ncbi:hypothetical protein RN001_005727 [Aquatica leii]|uniref:Nucleoporin Nup43 n=1 Tax=Aquatica leii TaxID=1421715 RepID=A0AAN7QKI6_9COLE|nr:hypothetical protein RN001_005727 [Aquatica leii]